MTSIFDEALKIAETAHAGQFRKDGKTPYISHIYGVIENTKKIYGQVVRLDPKLEVHEDWVLAVACLHDVIEDTEFDEEDLGMRLRGFEHYTHVIEAVVSLTKKPKGREDYVDYLMRVKNNYWARIVKLADLKHNMSDLSPGNLRDKYSISKYFLEIGNPELCLP